MKIVRQKSRVFSHYSYSLLFFTSPNGSGFSFDCEESGVPLLLNEDQERNYKKCLDMGLQPNLIKREHYDNFERLGLCDCGNHIKLTNFTNTCKCGVSYNSAGQQLSDSRYWGEETGEHPSDILRIS